MPVNSYGFYWDYLRETRPKPPLDPRGAGIADFWRISAVFGAETEGLDPCAILPPNTEQRPSNSGQRPSNSGHRTAASGHRTAAIESAGGRTMRRANRGGRYVSRTTGRAARGLIHYLERMQGKKTRHTVPGSMVDCGGAYNVRNTPSGSRNFISVQPAFGVPKSSRGSNPSKSPQIFPA